MLSEDSTNLSAIASCAAALVAWRSGLLRIAAKFLTMKEACASLMQIGLPIG